VVGGPPRWRFEVVSGGNEVGRLPLGLVIGSDAQLREQAEQEAYDAGEEHGHGNEGKRRLDERFFAQDLVHDGCNGGQPGHGPAEEPAEPEDVDGLLRVAVQEQDHPEVQNDLDDPLEPVVRDAVHARMVKDGHLRDPCAVPVGIHRYEAVHLAVERDAFEDLAPVGLQGATVVVQVHAGRARDEAVGDAAHEIPLEGVVVAILAPSRDQVESLVQFGDNLGDVIRVILEVPVHGHDDLAAGIGETGLHRRSLPAIAPEMDGLEPAVGSAGLSDAGGRPIGASVIDEEDLIVLPNGSQGHLELFNQRRDVGFLVAQRYDNGNHVIAISR